MSYVDELAETIRERIPAHLIPDGDVAPLFRIYAVLALAKGDQIVLEDVHDAWAAWMSDRDPEHPSLKPLRELTEEIQRSDAPYLDAIRTVARDYRLGR